MGLSNNHRRGTKDFSFNESDLCRSGLLFVLLLVFRHDGIIYINQRRIILGDHFLSDHFLSDHFLSDNIFNDFFLDDLLFFVNYFVDNHFFFDRFCVIDIFLFVQLNLIVGKDCAWEYDGECRHQRQKKTKRSFNIHFINTSIMMICFGNIIILSRESIVDRI